MRLISFHGTNSILLESVSKKRTPAAPIGSLWNTTFFAASTSVAIGHAALNMAIATYPTERFTVRNGILVIRQYSRNPL
jgi:hypothetical protein